MTRFDRLGRCSSQVAFMMRSWTATLLLLALAVPISAAERGPSTAEERARVVELVSLLETEPWSEEAPEARAWLKKFVMEVPDLTFKHCLSLLGTRVERYGIPETLLWQPTFSSAAYRLQNPTERLGSTATFLAGLEGVIRSYSVWREHGSIETVPRLEQLRQLRDAGQLEGYVRARSRNCR